MNRIVDKMQIGLVELIDDSTKGLKWSGALKCQNIVLYKQFGADWFVRQNSQFHNNRKRV
jgi:hypothetical protein